MVFSLRSRLIISFVVVIAICGIVATWVGVRLIGDGIIRQAQEKVRVDINSAREIYQENLSQVKDVIRLTSQRFFIRQNLLQRDQRLLKNELVRIREQELLDVLTVIDRNGRVVFRSRNPELFGDDVSDDPLVAQVLKNQNVVSSTEIVTEDELLIDGVNLAQQARIDFIQTPKAIPRTEKRETSGMMMKAAAPIYDDNGHLMGVICGGILLNRKHEIVDKIKETVFQSEVYKGKDIGTATIFQGDLRIATNVLREDGSRAIGTRVSEEVNNQVLINGLPWIERAFVVNNWYITAYEPIRNIHKNIIGMLYVGILEEKYADLKRNTMLVFLGIALASMTVALVVAYFLSNGILKPIKHLVFASEQLAQGDLSHRVQLRTKDEIGELAKTFNFMADSLRDRDERLTKFAQQKIMESERLATIGQLAAGVAHEINNPLGGILIYSHLVLENMNDDDPQKENLKKIVNQTTRCKGIVKGLLDFSRQTEPNIENEDINDILKSALDLLEHQTILQNITITKELEQSLPPVLVDKHQIQQVFINIILNAAEAIGEKGNLTIRTSTSEDQRTIKIAITDTGCGIAEEHIERLFEPFFTLKEVGKGTGLGLAISYGIIQQHQGTIAVKSKLGKGTTFTIRLPIVREELK